MFALLKSVTDPLEIKVGRVLVAAPPPVRLCPLVLTGYLLEQLLLENRTCRRLASIPP